ncbi:MAG: biosynthetic-type acetolactate synthase large subunit [Clostridium sp.]|nr:biosynthetic-type acetolactate synthase large subunit [Clostridium sp.]
MRLSGAELIIKLLENQNVKFISGVPGGFNLPIYDALYYSEKITHILARHEQGAGFIAQGISRSSDEVGVCFATSGPGATNLITAIADAKMDSTPLVAITGQVPLSAIGTDAFQEVDCYGLTMPITKHNYLIRDINELFTVIPEAFRIAKEGRPGPVLIDIPKNIQTQMIEVDDINIYEAPKKPKKVIDDDVLNEIKNMIASSKRPIIFAGGGVTNSDSAKELYDFAKKTSIPVTLSLMGLGTFPPKDELYLGMIGMHGAPYTNYLMDKSDLIIALGVRFDDRATGYIENFCPNASIIHIDTDPSEINKLKKTHISVIANLKDFLARIIDKLEETKRDEWLNTVNEYRNKYPLPKYNSPIHPVNLINFLSDTLKEDSIICTDVGQHQMWTAQRYEFKKPKTLLTSGGLGTMGFGLPAAIGASLINPDKDVVCISGDGSILMNIQELATLADHNLNVKLIILDNHYLGLVHQQQQLFYNKHYMASEFISNPDFETIAKGFGINSITFNDNNFSQEKFKEILSQKGPYVITIEISQKENVFPMVAPGASNTDMIFK